MRRQRRKQERGNQLQRLRSKASSVSFQDESQKDLVEKVNTLQLRNLLIVDEDDSNLDEFFDEMPQEMAIKEDEFDDPHTAEQREKLRRWQKSWSKTQDML